MHRRTYIPFILASVIVTVAHAESSVYRVWRKDTPGATEWTSEVYSGSLGNPIVNVQPSGAQVALRLTPGRPQQPQSPRLDHLRGALKEFDQRAAEPTKKLRELRRRLADVNQQLEAVDEGDRAREAQRYVTAREASLIQKLDQARTEFSPLALQWQGIERELSAQRAKAAKISVGVGCRTLGMGCNPDAAATQKLIDELSSERTRLRPAYVEAATAYKRAEDEVKVAQSQLKRLRQIESEAPAGNTPKIAKAREERERTRGALKTLEANARELTGWYTSTRSTFKLPASIPKCDRPLVYRTIVPGGRHPLYPDGDTKDADLGERSLVVCTELDQVTAVAIFDQGAHLIAYTLITRDRRGDITRLLVKDERDRTLEEHGWIKDDHASWFGYTFADAEDRLISVYANAAGTRQP